MDNQSISHTRWNCTYHIVMIPKYRRIVDCELISGFIYHLERMLGAREGELKKLKELF